MNAPAVSYDPITAEVINMAMQAIVLEMGITIERTSGQPAATDAKDYSCVLCKADGGSIAYYGNNLMHLGDSQTGTQAIVGAFDPSDIDPEDVFIYNDPFVTGALHQADVAVQAPVFHEGRLICWIFTNVHHADIGGMNIAGFCPESRDVFGEGLRMAPVKLVDAGKTNEALLSVIATNVRTPIVLGDVRSQIAAINVGRKRLLETIAEQGVDDWSRYLAINERLLDDLLGARIAAIPSGTYDVTDWVEYDAFGTERFVDIRCRLEVTDDHRLVFDFAGSGPQVPGYSNASRGTMLGSVLPAVLAALLPDHDVNAGAYRRVEVRFGEPGSITDPLPPGGTSGGHIDTGPRAMRAAHAGLMRAMLASSDEWIRSRSYALGGMTIGVPIMSGRRPSGEWGWAFFLDQQALGHGGLSDGDGVAFGGIDFSIAGREPDVETAESSGPVLYLWRREIPDSGGAGAYRGGNSLETGFVPWKVDFAELANSSGGGAVPTRGSRGGYPGGATWVEVYRGVLTETIERLPDPPDFGTEALQVPDKCATFDLGLRDAGRQLLTAGSGWGDPLLRPVEDVAADLERGSVTTEAIGPIYGVELAGDGTIDRERTAERRMTIRRERLGGREPAAIGDLTRRAAVVAREGRLHCDFCDAELGEIRSQGPRSPAYALTKARTRRVALAERMREWRVPLQAAETKSFDLVEQFCDGCGTLLEVDIEMAPE
jgi:N-methylhydantoinase B